MRVLMPKESKPPIDYKKELETASRGMIMIHEPHVLIKLIVRMIVSKVRIKHAGMLLYDSRKRNFVLQISRGQEGIRIPAGFARFDKHSPLIKIFVDEKYNNLNFSHSAVLLEEINRMIWRECIIDGGNGAKELLHKISDQMQLLNIVACVPAFYQGELLAVLLLGAKNDESKFIKEELDFFTALASDVAMAIRNAQLFADLKKEALKNKDHFLKTTIVLASAIEAKDPYTRGHTERVTKFSMAIARQMVANGTAEFSVIFLENLYIAGILHDIGKIGIPESILGKTDKLTKEEFDIMKTHPGKGAEILKPLNDLGEPLKGVKYHHERYDGKGYPDGLKGEDIPMIAAIISVADSFDAMISDRPYRKGMTKSEAIEEVKRNIGTQFNPLPARALVKLYEKGEI